MMKTMMVIFSLLFVVSCSSVRTFDLIATSGGTLKSNGVIVENGLVKIKIVPFENEYDLISFRFMLRNKSSKYLKLDVNKLYTKDPVGGLRYPLSTEGVVSVLTSLKTFETPKEKMEAQRQVSSNILRSGEIPPKSITKGLIFYEPGSYDVKEIAMVIRGLEADGSVVDFQNVMFREEGYADDLRKIDARKKARLKKKEKKPLVPPKAPEKKEDKPAEPKKEEKKQ